MTFYETPYPSTAAGYRPAPPYPAPDPYRSELARACAAEKKLLRRRCSWGGWATLAALLLTSMLFTAAALLCPAPENSAAMFCEYSFAYVVGFAAPALLLARALSMPLSAALPMQRVGVPTAIAAVVFGTAACNLANYPANLFAILLDGLGLSGEVPSYTLDGSPDAAFFLILSSCVIPALVEEFLFRGVMLRSLMRFGTGFAVVASSMLFALMHGNVTQILFAFPLGLLFSYFIVRTGNLWITIAIHFLNNLLASLYLVIESTAGAAAAELYSSVFPPVLWILGLAMLPLLCRRSCGFFRLQAKPSLLAAREKAGALFGNPGVIVFLCYTALSCVLFLIPS